MTNIQQGIRNKVYIENWTTKELKSMTQGDIESVRDFKRSGDLLKWSYQPFHGYNIFNCRFYYPCILFIIEAIQSKKEIFYIIQSLWFKKERLMLQFFSKMIFLWFE